MKSAVWQQALLPIPSALLCFLTDSIFYIQVYIATLSSVNYNSWYFTHTVPWVHSHVVLIHGLNVKQARLDQSFYLGNTMNRSFLPPAYKLAWKHTTQLSLHPQSLRGRACEGTVGGDCEVREGLQQGRGGASREGLPSCWSLAVDTPLQSLPCTHPLAHGAWYYYCPAATMESHAESGEPGHLGKMTWEVALLAASAPVSPPGPPSLLCMLPVARVTTQ